MAHVRSRHSSQPTPDQLSLSELTNLSDYLPKELLQPSYLKAIRALSLVVLILTTGYVGLAIAPWYALPVCWLIVGTAITGLVSVANDCERQIFVRNKFLNDCLGMICLLPLWMPFNTLAESASSGSWLNIGPLWLLRSLWQWIKANFAIPITCFLGGNSMSVDRKKLVVNLVCLYGFMCLFFPIMTMTLGWWGLFKYYLIPMGIYHFWMSTCLKLSDRVQGAGFTLCSYPIWVEFLGNNFNYLANSFSKLREQQTFNLPSYNLRAARRVLQQRYDTYQEINFGWDTFFNSTKQQIPIVMKIHGDWYDLTSFRHPGGPVALSLGSGRDATALFESHHPFTSRNRLDGLLNKYRISKEELEQKISLGATVLEKETEVFDWDESFPSNQASFAKELLSEVHHYFKIQAKQRGITLLEATKATPKRWVEMIGFLTIFVCLLPFFFQGYYFSLILVPIFAWLYAAAISHDAMHFAVSTNWKVNYYLGYICPWTVSPLMWYHQHIIGHHAYPNVPFKDPDLAHAPGFVRLHESVRWRPAHRYQIFSLAVIWTLGTTLYMTIVPIKALYQGMLNRSVAMINITTLRRVQHVLGRLLTIFALWGWPWYVFWGDLPRQILFTTVPMLIHSLCFMISTQFNHLTPENIKHSSKEFYTHQVVTSHSFSMKSQFIFWLTGGLNVQIEHHLFPTVNHCHLREISPIVQKLCKKYEIPYHESKTLFEAISKHFQHVICMSHA